LKFFRFLFAIGMLWALQAISSAPRVTDLPVNAAVLESVNSNALYSSLQLNKLGLSYQAFDLALKGMKKLFAEGKLSRTDVISIADLSQSSCKKRLYVINLETQQVIFQTYVAHGRNSGDEFATAFSNESSSYKSSLGFFTTMDTYTGEHGLSLHLRGEEKGINDHAFDRAIVMHAADYVSPDFIRQTGRLGRSLGCPAVATEICKPVINAIKGGSCFFIYYPEKNYSAHSRLLNS
jgi:hypothetical protein